MTPYPHNLELPKSVPLCEVVEFNPRFGKGELADDSLASFIPMKCVEAESGRFEPLGDRKVAEVCKGYTPFRDGDVIFAKVTPCMENGKAAVLPVQVFTPNSKGVGAADNNSKKVVFCCSGCGAKQKAEGGVTRITLINTNF